MTSPDRTTRDRATVADILSACKLARQFVDGLDREGFLTDEKTQAAVLHEITIVGEAVKRLSGDFRDAQANIPCRLIAGMRGRLIHQYNTVDLEEVWKTVTEDFPELTADLEALRSASDESPGPG